MERLEKDPLACISRHLDDRSFFALAHSCRGVWHALADARADRIRIIELARTTSTDFKMVIECILYVYEHGPACVDEFPRIFPRVTNFRIVASERLEGRSGSKSGEFFRSGDAYGIPSYKIGRWHVHGACANWTAPTRIFPGETLGTAFPAEEYPWRQRTHFRDSCIQTQSQAFRAFVMRLRLLLFV